MRISDWSSDVCSSDLRPRLGRPRIAGVVVLARLGREHRLDPHVLVWDARRILDVRGAVHGAWRGGGLLPGVARGQSGDDVGVGAAPSGAHTALVEPAPLRAARSPEPSARKTLEAGTHGTDREELGG